MAVYTEQSVRENLRVRDGAYVFFLAEGDHLTPSAAQWLKDHHVQLLQAEQAAAKEYRTLDGAVMRHKPEHMTHLRENILVCKDHPRIRFRGMVDALEAEILLVAGRAQEPLRSRLKEVLNAVRELIRCDVMEQPVTVEKICGFTERELRERSHYPQKYYGLPHFMPSTEDCEMLLLLNKLRTAVRQTELAAYEAFRDREGICTREDILRVLNRLSSMLWIMMIEIKKEAEHGTAT